MTALIATAGSLVAAFGAPLIIQVIKNKDRRAARVSAADQRLLDIEERHRMKLYKIMIELREETREQVHALEDVRHQVDSGLPPDMHAIGEQIRRDRQWASRNLDSIIAVQACGRSCLV
ncbi:hypothetical protein [Streptomyces glomeratus]|uniref:hypothetical protein n=1 Tax=Streptomyces glomeratus TaxID=284452 RepID=UPI001F3C9FD2|nr:hypothetical protein [Streptomyces glomeratus]MCF1512167.1 hypothetical protein [Streptomyces glomeratus]